MEANPGATAHTSGSPLHRGCPRYLLEKILARYAESIRNIEDPRNMEEGIEDETGDAQLEHPRTGEPSGGKRPAIQRTCMQLEMLEPGPHGTSMHHPGKSS
jgi:hypothetical protein